jgi:DNA end-binding protein Ku
VPQKFKDEVRERQLELIQRKIEGEDITEAPTEAPQTQIIDLMAALKASLARKGEDAAEDAGARKPAQRASAKRASKRKASGG